MERLVSLLGLITMIGLAWLMSSHKRRVDWRIVIVGLLLQFSLGLLILKTVPGQIVFRSLGDLFTGVLSFVDEGSALLFDVYKRDTDPGSDVLPPVYTVWRCFAFAVLPTIVFFSSLMAVLYHLGLMQLLVRGFAWVMRKSLGTSGAETLSAAANIFVGQTEAPLVIRPYLSQMTLSELNVVMVGGFATIAGSVLAAFVSMGIDSGHLITASVISAPAALLIAKVLQPETETPRTISDVPLVVERVSVNVIEAAAEGASTGMKLALNIAAMLIAFVALVAMVNAAIGLCGSWFGYVDESVLTLEKIMGVGFAPFAWLMGIPASECRAAGELLGTKMIINEFVAYNQLSEIVKSSEPTLSPRSIIIVTYALCGFANFSSIGIQLGGIGGLAPDRRSDLARLGFRAMLGGTLAAFMTACVAGILV